jgi:hypothetical protein
MTRPDAGPGTGLPLPVERHARDITETELRELSGIFGEALDLAGAETGPYILDVWLDRLHHGTVPIPVRSVLLLQEFTRRVLEGK